MIPLRKSTELINHTEDEVYPVIFQLITFACMLVTTTLLAVSTHSTYMFQFDSLIDRIFMKRESGSTFYTGYFEDLVTVSDWFDYVEQVFLKYWHNRDLVFKKDGKLIPKRAFLQENFHIGAARLRQIRIQAHSCAVHDVFNRYFNDCYTRYDDDLEDNSPSFRGFKNYPHHALPVSTVKGIVATYDGPGYVVFLRDVYNDNERLLDSLKSLKWVDRATRLLIIEFVLYNQNMNTFANVKLVTEVLPTGSLISNYRVTFLPIYSIWTTKPYYKLVLAAIFYALVVLFTAEELCFLCKTGFYDYVRSKWNWLDCFILITAYTALGLSIFNSYRVNNRLDTILTNANGDIFIDDLCYMHGTFRMLLTICAILVWLKIFRFISFNVTMLHFSMAISRSFTDIIGFAVMFFIVFIGYSLLGTLLFSNINPSFANLSNALVTMMRMIMGDYQYQNIEKADKLLGPIFFISYLLFIYFILLNMFLAIISETYVSVKEGLQPQRNNIIRAKLARVWRNACTCCKSCCRRKKAKPVAQSPSETDEESRLETGAKMEYYNSMRADLLDERDYEGTPIRTSDGDAELSKLSQRVSALEFDLEALISKMDRVLQKLDAKAEEKKTARSLGRKQT